MQNSKIKIQNELDKLKYRAEFLSRQKRLLFRLGIILPKTWKSSLVFFSAGSAIIFFAFLALDSANSAGRAGKQILGAATSGVESLQARDFSAAREKFLQAQASLDKSLLSFKNIDQALSSAAHLAAAGEKLSAGALVLQNSKFAWDGPSNSLSRDFYLGLKKSRDDFLSADNEMGDAAAGLADVNSMLIPGEYAEKLRAGLAELETARKSLGEIIDLENFALGLLGGAQKTYLLIFQNNNEARATGGFIGTYGVLDIGNGSMKLEKIESVYNLDGQLKERIAAPGPLQYFVSPLWGTRDANWFADFPDSSRKILGFFEKETGILASGIISFTPDVFENLLTLTGPITMPAYGETLTSENFRERVQYKTSIDYNRAENQPKKMLSDFAPLFLGKLSRFAGSGEAGRDLISALEIMARMISEKQLLMFSLDDEAESKIKSYDAGGEIKKTAGDYLAIYHSNMGGGKTDQGIVQSVEKTVNLDELGNQSVNLKITRSNQAHNEKFLPKNVDFMRVLVPAGSRIISAAGFDDINLQSSTRPDAAADPDLAFWDSRISKDFQTGIYIGAESGYTAFMDWLTLEPGQTKTVELSYTLPAVSQNYSLLLQKQPGARAFDFKLHIKSARSVEFGAAEVSERVNSDRVYGIVVK